MLIRKVYDPFSWYRTRAFGNFGDDLEQIRKSLFQTASAGVFPLINVTEDHHNYYARAELPGIDIKDLEIIAEGNTIALTGKREIASKDKDMTYHRRERESGGFSRKLTLPGDVVNSQISATLKEGILTIKLPKPEESKPRQIKVS